MEFRSHMLRDTFAVELLLSGMPIEDVSRFISTRETSTQPRGTTHHGCRHVKRSLPMMSREH